MPVELAASIVEGAGILVILGGAAVSFVWALRRWMREGAMSAYIYYRQRLGRSILLGLELLVGADIIRTVAEIPTLSRVAVLGGIVLIRTFLSWSLEVELDGRWPWQASSQRGESTPQQS